MPVLSKKMETECLQVGMYVSDIDRPWAETPFPLQGFHIKDSEHLRQVQHLCDWVKVDFQKSRHSINPSAASTTVSNFNAEPDEKNGREIINLRIRTIQNPAPYRVSKRLTNELKIAQRVHRKVEVRINKILGNFSTDGRLRVDQLKQVTADLVESIIRHPDAFAYLSRMDNHHPSIFSYSVRVATWTVLAGRHLNIAKDVLSDLTIAAMMCKVGYISLPKMLFDAKGSRSPQEEEMLKASLQQGVKTLQDTRDFSSRVIKIVSYHLERFDGSGYPRGVTGRHIPFLAQLVGLADYYESITSYDFCDDPFASTDAIRELYRQRNASFDGHLIEEFIQAIGPYPTGTVVKLTDNQLAIVVEQNPRARLRPKVVALEDTRRWWEFFKSPVIDLNKPLSERRISASLPPLPNNAELKQIQFFKRATSFSS